MAKRDRVLPKQFTIHKISTGVAKKQALHDMNEDLTMVAPLFQYEKDIRRLAQFSPFIIFVSWL